MPPRILLLPSTACENNPRLSVGLARALDKSAGQGEREGFTWSGWERRIEREPGQTGTKGSREAGESGYSKMPLPVPAGDAKALVSRSESPNFRETAVLPTGRITVLRLPPSSPPLRVFLLTFSPRLALFHATHNLPFPISLPAPSFSPVSRLLAMNMAER